MALLASAFQHPHCHISVSKSHVLKISWNKIRSPLVRSLILEMLPQGWVRFSTNLISASPLYSSTVTAGWMTFIQNALDKKYVRVFEILIICIYIMKCHQDETLSFNIKFTCNSHRTYSHDPKVMLYNI